MASGGVAVDTAMSNSDNSHNAQRGDHYSSQSASSQGVRSYFQQKLDETSVKVRDKQQNLRRLQAQRNELNSKGSSRFICHMHTHIGKVDGF